jgi:hypothetical protein
MIDLTFSYVWSNKHTVNLSGRAMLCCTDLVCAVYQKLNIFRTTLSQNFCIYFEIHEKLFLVVMKVQRRHKFVYYHIFLNFRQLEQLNVQRTFYEMQRSWFRNSARKLVTFPEIFHGFFQVRSGQCQYSRPALNDLSSRDH